MHMVSAHAPEMAFGVGYADLPPGTDPARAEFRDKLVDSIWIAADDAVVGGVDDLQIDAITRRDRRTHTFSGRRDYACLPFDRELRRYTPSVSCCVTQSSKVALEDR